jgi:hypothetical protein
MEKYMSKDFDSIEIRKAKNGFIVVLTTEEDTEELVFDSARKAIKMVREYVDQKPDPTVNG